jgi:hypothetical protein
MPNQPKKMMMKPYKKMGVITDKERKMLEKIDYAGDFDKELAKFEKVDGVETKRDRELKDKAARQLRAKSMMRTSKPELRDTKRDMTSRKK